MPSLIGTSVTANYLKTAPSTQFGTRKLAFIVVNNGANLESNYSNSNSELSKVVRALQQQVEIYGVGTPNGTEVTLIIADDTAPYDDGDENADGGRNSRLEAALDAAGLNYSVWNAKLDGGDLNWD